MARQQRDGLAKVHADLNRAETRRKAGVHSWIEEVAAGHQAMAQELRADLRKGHAGLKASVGAQLQELDRAHNTMARQQRDGLAKVHADLNRDETRRKAGVHSWIEEVAAGHQAMAQELRADLRKGHADLGTSVSAQVQELDRAHNAMARQQRETLAKVHSDLALAERQRKSQVKTWMEELATDHAAVRDEWQNLAATMRAKRAGAVAVLEAPLEMAPAPPVVEKVAPAAEVEEEAVEVGEVTAELASLSLRVFAYLASHPDGTRLRELEREFGLGRFQAARVVRHLMNEGKTKKEGLLYFAT
jgi:hypothetical protein